MITIQVTNKELHPRVDLLADFFLQGISFPYGATSQGLEEEIQQEKYIKWR